MSILSEQLAETNVQDRGRKILMRIFLMLVVPAMIIALAIYIYLSGGRYVSTDNAYVKSNIVQISTNLEGLITEVFVSENQSVVKGDKLFSVDARLFEKQLAVARADVAAAVQEIAALRSRYREGQTATAAAEERVRYLGSELKRQRDLLTKGLGTRVQLDAVEHDARAAEQRLQIQRQINRTVLAELGGNVKIPTEQHPFYLRAVAEKELVMLNLSYAEVRAPVNGMVTNVALKTGEYVEAGELLLAIVDGSTRWVEANLKEVDLEHVHIGQEATVILDSLPNAKWRAVVASIAPVTGAEFSLLPPQNATGNWVKVVQRVPVRLTLSDSAGLEQFRVGLTANVSIDTGQSRDIAMLFNRVLAGTHEP
jgi:membrane fusion protein, multidrug efflux system